MTASNGVSSTNRYQFTSDATTLLASNNSAYGETVTFGGSGSSTARKVYNYRSTGWNLSDANSATGSKGLLAIAQATRFNDGMLIRGYYYHSDWSTFTVGDTLYLSAAATGDITNTQPTGTGDIVRVVGYCIDDSTIYFNPSQDWIELV